jgi:hypothetical protein
MKKKPVLMRILTVVTSVLMLATVGIGSAHATSLSYYPDGTVVGFSLDGIRPAGAPNFENSVRLKVLKNGNKGFKLRVRRRGRDNYFNASPLESYKIKGGNYQLNAFVDTDGNFLKGDLKIRGRVDTPVGMAKGILMTATLTSFAYDSSDLFSSLLGFNTTDIWCNSVINVLSDGCTTNESVYLALNEGGFDPTLQGFKSLGTSVATVPVPAAVWLFGSGLIALVGMTRRRKH